MMRFLIFFVFIVNVLVSSSPVKSPLKERRYYPEEEDPYRIKHLLFQDENGVFHDEDLTLPIPITRASLNDVTLYLYTVHNKETAEVMKIADLNGLDGSQVYDPAKPNFFIIHGWNNNYKSSVNTLLKGAILKTADVNVFVVDWSGPADKFYISASSAVPKIGEALGDFINRMMYHYNLTPKMFKMIGHSLGAHVAGCAGAAVNGLVDYIVGLDPAGPLYSVSRRDNRLDETDAEFVQIVHTSGFVLSFVSSIGHADYFPNDGSGQPGCGLDILRTCAHSRAYEFYEESIRHGGFTSTLCNNYRSFIKGKCSDNHQSYLGGLFVDKNAVGDYYLDTQKKSLYSL